MKKVVRLALFLPLFVTTLATAADRNIYTLQIKTDKGIEQRIATAEWRDSDGFPNPCGATLKYGGMADDGVRVLNCDGSGSYIDGIRKGRLKWGYALSPDNKNKLIVKSFNEWQVDQIIGDAPAAKIYIEFTDGELKGRGLTEVLGLRNGYVAMSPYYFGKK
jgi:hypothetical protein